MAIINTPVKGFTGTVAGVQFADGQGETENVAALAYFERQGYTVTAEDALPDPPNDPADGEGSDNGAKQPAGDGTVLDRPAGNASLEAWQAYALQEGHTAEGIADLKREDIKALFTE